MAVVALEAFNPKTLNILKVVGGFREQLQFVPFFIFGYLLVRSKARIRKAFILLGVIALANGVVSTYQTRLSPTQLAAWGSGYARKYEGKASRVYKSEGIGRVRPTGLGDESGAGGGVGVAAIAATLALLATTRRKKWLLVLLTIGAFAAFATGLGRVQFVGGLLAIVGYLVLTSSGGHPVPKAATLAARVAGDPHTVLGGVRLRARGGTFSRYYSSLLNGASSAGYKENELGGDPEAHLGVPVRVRARDGRSRDRPSADAAPNCSKATTSTPRRPTTSSSSRKPDCPA